MMAASSAWGRLCTWRGTRAAASHATRPQPLRVPNRLAGLVQAPLLCRLGAPEAARLPRLQLGPELDGDRGELAEHRGELERDRDELEGDWGELECLLAAAELARRGLTLTLTLTLTQP